MKLMINNSSMVPIYEQLVAQIGEMIASGELGTGALLPSVRALSKELKISALTVKKAYDALEETGLVKTVHGKGTFVAEANPNRMREERIKEVENLLEEALRKGRLYGLTPEELREIFEIQLEK
ncbi:MAG: GntR family transcriptional regulator [Muribaculum sp.]|nr:GntR family transcriptional regulator [Muribaculum sp.]